MAANNVKLSPEIDQLTQKLVADPKSRVFAQLADAYRKSGMLDEAIETAKRGLEVHPGYAIAHNILGRCYLEKKMLALAVEEFQLTVRSDPQNLIGYKMLATAYERQGAIDEALRHYRMVLDLEPGEIEVAEKIEALRAQGAAVPPTAEPAPPAPEPEPAQPLQEPAVTAVPEPAPAAPEAVQADVAPPAGEPDAAVSLPDALRQPEPEPEAELVIEKAPEPFAPEAAAPPSAEAAAPAEGGEATPTLADIYAQQGHFEKAIEIYQSLVRDNPDNGEYKSRLDELLAKAYPDEAPPAGKPRSEEPAVPEPPAQPAPAAAEVPDKMFSQMFAEMEQAVGGAPAPVQQPAAVPAAAPPPVPEPPAAADAPPSPAPPEPLNIGALFAAEEKPADAGTGVAAGQQGVDGGAEPKKDDAVSSFQSWLNSLQK
ncbi:MAG: tetratricopeptide repeat protein [Candidatus Edwardsbacteria bacterium]|jgi:tetratricopeptide (TPR) repeat protein|nr:tetratricopeptide repeat protein [Candidatus Edwardsbacteria bacterium]